MPIAIAGSSDLYTGMMKSLLLRRAKWAFEPRLLWTSAVFLFVTAAVVLVVHPNLLSGVAGQKQEQVIRWWGVALQMVGILAVLNDLWSLREQFGLESASTWLRKWLARWPSRNVILKIEGVGAATQTGSVTSARGYVGPGHSASAEVRLSALEQHAHALRVELDSVRGTVEAERRERQQAAAIEAAERSRSHSDLANQLKKATTESIPFSLFGLLWLALGVVLSSTSPEVACWMKAWLGQAACQ